MRNARRHNTGYRRNTIAGRWRPWLREDLPIDDGDVTPLHGSQPPAFDDSPTLWDQTATLGDDQGSPAGPALTDSPDTGPAQQTT